MKLEIGMYVRTDNGIIGRIYEKIGDMFTYKDSNRSYITYGASHNEIIKASFDVIDLIEVGDYVNGSEVYKINWDSLGLILETTDYSKFREKDIKSIVTHEQMEQMSYEIGE